MLKTRRAFIRAIKGLPIERQRQMATDARCGDIYEHGEFKRSDMDERELWVRSLRADDTAWVPDLRVLLRTKAELGRARVTADFTGIIAAICSKRAVVEEGRSGVRSDTAAWANQVQSVVQKAHLAARSTAKINAGAKTAREAKAKRQPNGLVAAWSSPDKKATPEWQAAFIGWRSREPLAKVRETWPDELANASWSSLERIFGGGRDPARKGQGGRPPKTKQKKLKTRR